MCLFSTVKEPVGRNFNDPPPHRSYYSAHPDGVNATQARLPDSAFRRSNSRRRSRNSYDYEPRRTRDVIDYERTERREIDYTPVRREIEYAPARPRSSTGSVGLPRGYVREVRPPPGY